ncbi:pterin-4-alpha-carbinolamine dehydratase, partial [Trypanosoma theileri]
VIPLFSTEHAVEEPTLLDNTGELPVALHTTTTRTSTSSSTPTGTPPPASGGMYTATRIKYRQAPHRNTSNLEDVATSIIAAAGLPMSMISLADYITEGQPQLPYVCSGSEVNAVGQSYTQIHPPPQGCSWFPPRSSGNNHN